MLANPRSDRIRKVAALGGRSARLRQGSYLIEGPQAVREAVNQVAGDLVELYVDLAVANPAIGEIIITAQSHELVVNLASAAVLRAISTSCQGIVAVARLPLMTSLEQAGEVLDHGTMVMCLPWISDPGNLGTLVRIADAAGAAAILLGEHCVEITNPKVIRASVGSIFHLPIITAGEFGSSVAALRAKNYVVIGADGNATAELPNIAQLSAERVAWVFGNEAHGLSPQERESCDVLAKVPLLGRAESLNVAAAAAVCLYTKVLAG